MEQELEPNFIFLKEFDFELGRYIGSSRFYLSMDLELKLEPRFLKKK
jgi:hypothetical protein